MGVESLWHNLKGQAVVKQVGVGVCSHSLPHLPKMENSAKSFTKKGKIEMTSIHMKRSSLPLIIKIIKSK